MHWIDWSIVGVLLVVITGAAFWTKRFNRSVVDFLSANRCAGRYILALAEGMALLGAIVFVAQFEQYYVSGYTSVYWMLMTAPLFVAVYLTGWIAYRFRQTRVLTFAQFLEIRYSRKFRIFAGSVLFIAGIINFGIFPGIGTKFFINFCNLPPTFGLFGLELSTFIFFMIGLLALSVIITLWGGQIAIMVTDFLQGTIMFIVLLAIALLYFYRYDSAIIYETIIQRGPGESLLNPFDTGQQSFNYWYIALIMPILSIYNYKNWQNVQGYNTSAKSPHEARMAGIVGQFRWYAFILPFIFVPICAYTVMHHPSFSGLAEEIRTTLSTMDSAKLQGQMVTPIFLSKTLPIGLMGLFLGVVFFAFVSTHDTFLHSWACVLVQDVLIPLRGKPLEAKQHTRWLRWAVIGVAVFAFLWSCLFVLEEHIAYYWMITSAVFLSGSGVVVIGGLYWKRGTTAASYTAMIIGGVLAVGGLTIRCFNPEFPISAPAISIISAGVAVISYITVSLLGSGAVFNLDQMLHRGKYAIQSDEVEATDKELPKWKKRLTITKEFTKGDLAIYFLMLGVTVFFSVVSLVLLIWYFLAPKLGFEFGNKQWFAYYEYYIYFLMGLAVITAIWFLIGGCKDLKNMFKTLGKAERSGLDDGWVEGHHSLVDEQELPDVLED